MTIERLAKASDAIKEDVCGILCPSVWKTAEGRPPHHPKCVELRAALGEAIDEMSYADLHASGGIRGADMPPESRSPGIDPKTGKYSTAQMMKDEMTMGDTSQPLFD